MHGINSVEQCSDMEDSATPSHSMIHNGRPFEGGLGDCHLHSTDRFEVAEEMQSGACGRIFRVRKRRRPQQSPETKGGDDDDDDVSMETDKQSPVANAKQQQQRQQKSDNDGDDQIYVLKVIDGERDERLLDVSRQEARILRLLAASPADGEHSDLLCLPVEMWRCTLSNHLHIVFPLRPMDLFQYMTRRNYRGLSLLDTGRVMHQTVRAAACLHRQFRIVHNDIKPENVLVEPRTMQCWLTDYGGACELDRINSDGYIVMTYMYASPERLRRSGDYSELSDSWSLGMLAAELANGSSVVDSLVAERRWSELMRQCGDHQQQLLDEPDFVERLAPTERCRRNKRSRGLRSFLFATLALQPEQRLSAAQLLDETHECSALYAPLPRTNRNL